MRRNISVVGAGYVGLVTAACFADLDHHVTLIEIDGEKLHLLKHGIMPVHEADLPEMWERNRRAGRLRITSDYQDSLRGCEIVFICVGTPSGANGKADLRWVRSAAKSIARNMSGDLIVVNKSTVPVGTAEFVYDAMSRYKKEDYSFTVVSNPEFLREGCAVYDFMNPTRVVVGCSDANAAQIVAQLYEPMNCPLIVCDAGTAEMSKYASNAFLATRISFMNEIAQLCDKYGVNVVDVARVVGYEPRCGNGYLGAGLGWGGSCLPKDVRGLIYMSQSRGLSSPLLRSVLRINSRQPQIAVEKLRYRLGSLNGKTVGILGLAFKPDSDDMREASSLVVISLLQEHGCNVKAYDPASMEAAARLMPSVTYCADAYEVAHGSDAIVLVTEWDEFRHLDMRKIQSLMRYPLLLDGRNLYDPKKMIDAGFIYEGIGRDGIAMKSRSAPPLEIAEPKLSRPSGQAHTR